MDRDELKKALDYFENDEFVNAKEILQAQIKNSKEEFLKNKLGLKDKKEVKEPEPKEEEDSTNKED